MRLFRTTIPFYIRYRLPYPDALLDEVAASCGATRRSRLLDLGCGPGFLALALAPRVGEVIGLDPEPGMIEAAREAARQADVPLRLIQGFAEEMDEALGPIRLVTIGRAFHWMDQPRVLAKLDRMIEPGGGLALFADRPVLEESGAWAEAWRDFTMNGLPPGEAGGYDPQVGHEERHGDVLRASAFSDLKELSCVWRRRTSVEELLGRALSMAATSPERLGNRRPAFEAAFRTRFEPFAEDGVLTEVVEAFALVARRPGGISTGI